MGNILNRWQRSLIQSWHIVLGATRKTNHFFITFLQVNYKIILAFFIPTEILHHFFLNAQRSGIDSLAVQLPAKLGLLSTSLLMFVFYGLLVPLRIPEIERGIAAVNRQDFWRFTARYMVPFTLEGVRAFSRCLLWLIAGGISALVLAGVLQFTGFMHLEGLNQDNFLSQPVAIALAVIGLGPFVYYSIRYYFVAYIVLTDPEYEAGRVDALKRSIQVSRGLMIPLFIVLGLFFLLDIQRSSFRAHLSLLEYPIRGAMVAIVFELISIYANILLFEIYRLRVRTLNDRKVPANGTHI